MSEAWRRDDPARATRMLAEVTCQTSLTGAAERRRAVAVVGEGRGSVLPVSLDWPGARMPRPLLK